MKRRLSTTLVLAVALVAATFSALTTITPSAKAAPGQWNVKGCPPGDPRPAPPCTNDNAILLWDEELLATIRANPPGTGPTVAARALGVLHTATYDAWEAYDPTAKSTLPNSIPEPQASSNVAADKAKAISFAAYTALTDLFPYRRPVYATRLGLQDYSVSDNSPAANVGRTAAQAVINYRHTDGSNQTRNNNGTPADPDDDTVTYPDNTGYQPTKKWNEETDPWHWQPLCVRTPAGVTAGVPPEPDRSDVNNCTPSPTQTHYTTQRALTPQWPKIKTFAASPLQYKVTGPPKNPDGTYSNADVATALNEASNLNDTKKVTAEYWADGPGSEFPPGHMAVFAQALSRKKVHTLDTDVKMFFALGNALLDASVGSWTTKYKKEYDFWRPITAIRYVYREQTTIPSWRGPVPPAEWTPYQLPTVVTPAFPEYVSGHSTFSAAGNIVLSAFTTSDIFDAYVDIPANWSKIQPGVPASPVRLSWQTFTAAADQAGISRRYGGIHFWSGDYHARMLGNLLGRGANSKAQSYIQGRIGS